MFWPRNRVQASFLLYRSSDQYRQYSQSRRGEASGRVVRRCAVMSTESVACCSCNRVEHASRRRNVRRLVGLPPLQQAGALQAQLPVQNCKKRLRLTQTLDCHFLCFFITGNNSDHRLDPYELVTHQPLEPPSVRQARPAPAPTVLSATQILVDSSVPVAGSVVGVISVPFGSNTTPMSRLEVGTEKENRTPGKELLYRWIRRLQLLFF